MWNDWFSIGPITIHGYGVMIAIGILFAFYIAGKLAKENGLDPTKVDGLVFACVFGGFIGAKLVYILTVWNDFLKDPWLVIASSGFVVYGGIIAGILIGYLYCRKHHISFMNYFNYCIPAVAIAQAFGRIGCFFAGCCYGIPTDAWYGVKFPANSLGPGADIAVIPTELISSVGNFVIFALLLWNLKHGKHKEDTGAWYLILYGIGRFLIEFLRGDTIRGQIWIFSTSQFISIFVFLFGAYLIYRRQKKEGR